METRVQRLNKYYIRISDEYGKITVYWLRPVSARKESLYTIWTKHRFYEMQYVLSGSIDFRLPGGQVTAAEGEFLLIAPGICHEIINYAEETEKLVFAFDAVLFHEILEEGLKKVKPEVKPGSDTLLSLAQLLIAVGTDSSITAGIQIKCLVEAFIFEILHLTIPDTADGQSIYKKRKISRKEDFINEVSAYISASAEKGFVTVEELADAFHIGRRHLDRICMEAVGKTAHQMIEEERLIYIRELLAVTDYSLRDIAFLCGFASEYSLSRFFKSKEGYSPIEYRKYTTQ